MEHPLFPPKKEYALRSRKNPNEEPRMPKKKQRQEQQEIAVGGSTSSGEHSRSHLAVMLPRRESILAVGIPATGAMAAAGAREGAQASAPEAPESGAIAASATRKNKRLRRLDNSAPSPRDAMSKK